jgi:hypothetical protein
MRDSEYMAYAMYLSDYNAINAEQGKSLQTWDELSYEEQTMYLRHVSASFHYLFDNGKISAYISNKSLEKYKAKYREYLATKEKR